MTILWYLIQLWCKPRYEVWILKGFTYLVTTDTPELPTCLEGLRV